MTSILAKHQQKRYKAFTGELTVPVYQRFYQFVPVKLVIVVGIVHFEIMELELLLRHFARIDGNVHVFLNMSARGRLYTTIFY